MLYLEQGVEAMQTTDTKQHAHELIDQLDSTELATAVRFLELIAMDPMTRSITTAPVDDEPLTDEEDRAPRRADAWLKQNGGQGIPHEEVLGEFGLSMEDFPLG